MHGASACWVVSSLYNDYTTKDLTTEFDSCLLTTSQLSPLDLFGKCWTSFPSRVLIDVLWLASPLAVRHVRLVIKNYLATLLGYYHHLTVIDEEMHSSMMGNVKSNRFIELDLEMKGPRRYYQRGLARWRITHWHWRLSVAIQRTSTVKISCVSFTSIGFHFSWNISFSEIPCSSGCFRPDYSDQPASVATAVHVRVQHVGHMRRWRRYHPRGRHETGENRPHQRGGRILQPRWTSKRNILIEFFGDTYVFIYIYFFSFIFFFVCGIYLRFLLDSSGILGHFFVIFLHRFYRDSHGDYLGLFGANKVSRKIHRGFPPPLEKTEIWGFIIRYYCYCYHFKK